MHFQVYRDAAQQHRWALFANNNRRVADSGEGYWNEADCLHGVSLVKGTNTIRQFSFYQDAVRAYRWRLLATNNRIIADSGEGYTTLAACEAGAQLVVDTNGNTPVYRV